MPRKPRKYQWDAQASDAALQHALQNVSRGAGDEWLEDMYVIVVTVARTCYVLTSDDVWWMAEQVGLAIPNDRRALGPVMQRCAHENLIRRDWTTEKTMRVSNHRRDLNAWQSLICRRAVA